MKQEKRTYQKALGTTFLFLLVFGMLFGPYVMNGQERMAKADDEGWSQYFISTPAAKTDLEYNREEQELISEGTLKEGYSINYYAYPISSAPASYDAISEDGRWNPAIPNESCPGTYSVAYQVQDSNGQSKYFGTVRNITMEKLTPKYDLKPEPKTLVYNGEAQVLMNGGTVKQVAGEDAGCVEYQLNGGTYSKDVNDIQAEKAGTYDVSYKITPVNRNHYDWNYNFSPKVSNILETTPETISVSIEKAPLEDSLVITAPAIQSGLNYDGKEHTLITPGDVAVKAGSLLSKESATVTPQMQYSLGENGNYSATLPTAKDSGTYTVWYKVGSDSSNYADTTPQSLTVTIAGSSSGSGSGGGGSSSGSGGGSGSGSSSTAPAVTTNPETPSTEGDGEYSLIRSSDGSRTDLWVKKTADGSTIETRKTTYPDGKTSETETRISADRKTIIKVQIYYNADGKRIDSAIDFTKRAEEDQIRMSLNALSSLLEKDSTGALRKDAAITLTSLKEDGTEHFTISMDSSIVNEKHPQIYRKNAKGGLLLVNRSYNCTVTENGELLLTIPESGGYQLVGEETSKEIKEEIYNSVKPEHKKLRLDNGQTTRFLLDDGCDPENILSITYHSSNKKRVKVTRSGKIQMKKAGKPVTITADVTFADGTVIQTKMKIRSGKL